MVQVHAPHPWQTSFTEQAPPKKNNVSAYFTPSNMAPKNDLVLPTTTTTSVGQSSKPRVQQEVSSKRFRTRVAKPPCHP
eukprot:scaffold15248_cov146-Amphora_coffeaeformis.AAC.1